MSHQVTFSIIGAHIKNAEKEVNSMFNVDNVKIEYGNYSEREEEIFVENIKHGVLALYSLNAALESLVAYLADKLEINKEIDLDKGNKFYNRLEKLKENQIITDENSLSTCIELRNYRNTVTHWEENTSYLYGSSSYLPFMFGSMEPEKDVEKLISIFNKKRFNKYIQAFERLLDNIIYNTKEFEEGYLRFQLECMKNGELIFE